MSCLAAELCTGGCCLTSVLQSPKPDATLWARPCLAFVTTCKSQRPKVAALFLLAGESDPAWQLLLKGMIKSGTVSARALGIAAQTPRKYGIRYDVPQDTSGVLKADALPAAVKLLHVRLTPKLTFVFRGKVAGLPVSVLWDSGAALSFIDARFVKRHKLTVQPCSQSVEGADGSLQAVSGVMKAKLRINKAVTATTLLVLNLTPAFDVILGRLSIILADYGYDESVRGAYCRANLLLLGVCLPYEFKKMSYAVCVWTVWRHMCRMIVPYGARTGSCRTARVQTIDM